MDEKTVNRIGWFASAMAMLMFASYLDQIRLNLGGRPGSVILPVATTVNGIAWVCYAFFKTRTDWPIVVCNAVGAVLGLATAVTALLAG